MHFVFGSQITRIYMDDVRRKNVSSGDPPRTEVTMHTPRLTLHDETGLLSGESAGLMVCNAIQWYSMVNPMDSRLSAMMPCIKKGM